MLGSELGNSIGIMLGVSDGACVTISTGISGSPALGVSLGIPEGIVVAAVGTWLSSANGAAVGT